ncbi:MAG: efflux RND transporter periplasmic adaptor subunit [Acidobacteriota bacterium]
MVLLCVLTACSSSEPKEEPETKPVVTVKTAKAEIRDLTVSVSAPATIFAREQANVTSRMTAPIQTLHVQKGSIVRAGQSLATLDHRDLDAQRADAQAQLADAEAALERIRSGTIPADLDQKRGAMQIAEAALNQAKLNAQRREALFKEGAIPQRDLLQAQTDLAQAQTNYDVARRAIDFAQNQTNDRDIRSAQARVDSARARVELASTQLQYTDVRAPFSGIVTEQFVFAGDLADVTKPLFQLMDLSVVNARAQITESDARNVHQGQSCTFASVDDSKKAASGSITVVNQSVDAQRRTLEVWCQIDNPNHTLEGNAFGEVKIVVQRIPNAVVVPGAALEIQQGSKTGSLLIVDDKNIAHRVEVEPGGSGDGMVQILHSVKAGDNIVIEGGYALPDGTQVEIAKEEVKGKE